VKSSLEMYGLDILYVQNNGYLKV